MTLDEEEIIRNRVNQLVPDKIDHFPKLLGGEPYRFDRWSQDKKGRLCLYYVVTGGKKEYRKRVPMQELAKAAMSFGQTGKFDRTDFRRSCPIAYADGSCGYAVVLRILESLYNRKIVT